MGRLSQIACSTPVPPGTLPPISTEGPFKRTIVFQGLPVKFHVNWWEGTILQITAEAQTKKQRDKLTKGHKGVEVHGARPNQDETRSVSGTPHKKRNILCTMMQALVLQHPPAPAGRFTICDLQRKPVVVHLMLSRLRPQRHHNVLFENGAFGLSCCAVAVLSGRKHTFIFKGLNRSKAVSAHRNTMSWPTIAAQH